jgi:TolB-like protein/Flp pilus assembly protein TadD
MGTPAYMSPEQARGLDVDKRTDIWAFGCCLFECLSGRKPFEGKTASDLMAAVLKSEPNWDLLPAETPPEVLTLLRRCLEKDPPRRLSSMGDIALTLEETARSVVALDSAPSSKRRPRASWLRPALVGGLLLVVVAGALLWISRSGQRSAAPTPGTIRQGSPLLSTNSPAAAQTFKSIAVLPFVSMSADKADEYLSDGMTEELLNVLAKVPGLHVPGRSSCFAFKGKNEEDIFRKVGEQLHVATVLEGSVRKAGEKLRITTQLINVADGFLLWSETYPREMKDILSVQTEVAQRVVQALEIKLGVEESRALAKTSTENPEAHRLYLLGRYHLTKFTHVGWSNALVSFNDALKLDPGYALAYSGLADTYGWMGGYAMAGREAWARQRDLAKKALSLDASLAEAELSLGSALANAFDWQAGLIGIKRALEMDPNLAAAHDNYAFVLASLGRSDEAIQEAKKAVELDPLSSWYNLNLAWWYRLARRYDEAVAQARKAVDLDPNYAGAHGNLAHCLESKGELAAAIREYETATRLDPNPWFIGWLGHAHALAGESAKAEEILHELDQMAKQRYVSPFPRALIYVGLGQKDKALDWLERSFEDQDVGCYFLKVDPVYDDIRDQPRFQALLKKVGLDQ